DVNFFLTECSPFCSCSLVYNLNMSYSDNLDSIKLTNALNSDFNEAVRVAIRSFNDDDNWFNRITEVVQQVVYYLTNNATSHGGIILVNSEFINIVLSFRLELIFFENVRIERDILLLFEYFGSVKAAANSALKELASENYYF
ncbi:hypothetical protein PENTCL1PPCAC_3629, partial [Pristionchus entomophagus]